MLFGFCFCHMFQLSSARWLFVSIFLFLYSMFALLMRPITYYGRRTAQGLVAAAGGKQDRLGDNQESDAHQNHSKLHLNSFSSDGKNG